VGRPGLLWHDFKVTAGEVLLASSWRSRRGPVRGRAALLPHPAAHHLSLLVASQTVPIVIVAPLLVVWLGYDLAPKLAIIGLICFFPITVTTLDGLGVSTPTSQAHAHARRSRLQAFRRVEAPTALPALFSGRRSPSRWR
jgi:ABC-type nitrate/sulfonate/bicarbonate transport system permease component